MNYHTLLFALFCIIAPGISAIAQDQPQLPSIYSMVVGQETWELVENRQLTFAGDGEVTDFAISPNGKQVAYICKTPDQINLCLANSSGGKPVAVIKTPLSGSEAAAGLNEVWLAETPIAWSPNSKMLAFPAVKATGTGEDEEYNWYVVVLNSNGSQKAALPLEPTVLSLDFSPDSRELTAITSSFTGDPPTQEPEYIKTVFDVSVSAAKVVSSGPSDWELDQAVDDGFVSPDGSLNAYVDAAGISVKNVKTGKAMQAAKLKSANLLSWLPNNLICYKSPVAVSADKEKHYSTLNTLWLLNPTSDKNNTMCAAFNIDDSQTPSWSSDGTRTAYTARGRLYVAEITRRTPSPYEKAAAGMPLGEEEMKTVLHHYANMIDIALEQFRMDHRDSFPTSMEDLTGFVQPDVFYKPGTGELIFQFGGESASGQELLGTFDAGYNWKIEMGRHGGVEEVNKQ